MEQPAKYVKFRENEQDLLAAFITRNAEALAANVIVLGYKSVGKTHVVLRHLENLGIRRTVLNCDEFITQKILLQNCLHKIKADSSVDLSKYTQRYMYKGLEVARLSALCETFAHFLMALDQFVQETGYSEPHVLVLDRFDQCLEATDDLFRSFVLMRENSAIRNISVVYVISNQAPHQVSTLDVPCIPFMPYSLEQVTEIVAQNPFTEVREGKVNYTFWAQFAKLVVDLHFDYTGSDLSLVWDICLNLWPLFVAYAQEEQDFLAIYRKLKPELVKDEVISNSAVTMYETGFLEDDTSAPYADLPHHSKFILIAAYLASYNDQKMDVQLFSKVKSPKKRSPRKLPEKSHDSPLKNAAIDSRLLSASYFDLERMKAILSVIYRNESHTLSKDNQEYFNLYHDLTERDLAKKETEFNTFTLNKNVDLNVQIATLAGLGLISSTYSKDPLSNKIRWRCNVGWDVIDSIAQDMKFPLLNYTVEK
ncbi:hypothetical protein METBIDRAFT_78666 [Metschnikowia bicuspidata var. bicuspidata NRRL YB-4993]|uniref:Uncharacterized protein n=1 Tax=Metschnikowia bicuspidata var. bicuspidata NRRL YB-4993 TaxID=869754 RepID=A0A1A0H8K0_9ASCO|nr:hypothetical protein METBIDRAFT_78666 [Metschnikowia bicuspidata var. bicuspidata NRRL YB-4993]OBA20212.1 hypothetical protein METBIDRAFT_78666 [Metschnikowia bicuspidata var. bicuspidata NRRL YB-4993]